jgi:Fe-S oxidoreductase
MGYAKIFYAAGITWTTSTYASEGGNFGLFLDYRDLKKVNQRIVEGARRLKVKKVVMGECGHAWRAAQAFTNTINGPLDFLEKPRPQHICELTVELLRKGVFEIDPSRNDDLRVTLHDPCNAARAGGVLDEPREILRAVCNNFIEMPRNTIRENTFCCGGGGGLLADEIMEVRMAGVKPRADAVKTTGANVLAVPCAICKANLPLGMEYWKTGAVVMGVSDLLARAMLLPGQKETEPWPVEGLRPL